MHLDRSFNATMRKFFRLAEPLKTVCRDGELTILSIILSRATPLVWTLSLWDWLDISWFLLVFFKFSGFLGFVFIIYILGFSLTASLRSVFLEVNVMEGICGLQWALIALFISLVCLFLVRVVDFCTVESSLVLSFLTLSLAFLRV